MIEFLVSWAEQLIIALIIIIIIEIVLPSGNNYKKYIKVVLGIFLIYTIINPIIGKKISNLEFKEVIANTYSENNIKVQNVIDYDEQIEKNFKIKFEENLSDFLKQNGYKLEKIEQDITYTNEEITINKLKLKIKKDSQENEKIEKIEIKRQEIITNEEIKEIVKKISDNYEIDESKIIIESENTND